MTQRLLHPETTAAVILGASDWTESGLGSAPSFRRSGKGFLSYLIDPGGLRLSPELVLDLFDDPASAGDQLGRVRDTIDGLLRERRDSGRPVADVVVYYVGHGTTDDQGHLSLLVRRSRKGLETETGIRAPDLARVLRVAAPQQRRLVVLDCCFAEAAVRAFVGMGAPEQAVAAGAAKDIAEAMPGRGGLLLCSSQMGDISVGAPAADRTLFTGAMLHVLQGGTGDNRSFLSFSDVCEEAYKHMLEEFGATAPRPVLHAINQVHGDLSRLPAFPNIKESENVRGQPTKETAGTSESQPSRVSATASTAEGERSDDLRSSKVERRLQLVSKWVYEEIIPDENLEFVLSAALEEINDRTAVLVRRVLDSPNSRAGALMAVLLGIEDGTISRRSPAAARPAQQHETNPEGQPNTTGNPFAEAILRPSKPEVMRPVQPDKAQILDDVRSALPQLSPQFEVLGKYEIRRVIGRGAAGTVYEGWDPVIGRRVAIKTTKIVDAQDPEMAEQVSRFRREAQAAGRLTHPNIVSIFDYGETQDDLAYIVMEFVDGPSLKSLLLKSEPFALADTIRVMQDLLAGLQFSHERGVIHRDIKPGNVMLTSTGQAKITDFGIARIESSSITQTGTLIGTPAYMSPEQFMGEVVNACTDIYSAGVLLYQLLTGTRPFDGGMSAIMHKALHTEPPAPSQLTKSAPRSFDDVVRRAMAKRPQERFQSASSFAEALHLAQVEAVEAPVTDGDHPTAGPATFSSGQNVGDRAPEVQLSTRSYKNVRMRNAVIAVLILAAIVSAALLIQSRGVL